MCFLIFSAIQCPLPSEAVCVARACHGPNNRNPPYRWGRDRVFRRRPGRCPTAAHIVSPLERCHWRERDGLACFGGVLTAGLLLVPACPFKGGAIPDGVDAEEGCRHGQEDSSDDVECDQGDRAFPLGDHQEPPRAEGQAGRSPVPSQRGMLVGWPFSRTDHFFAWKRDS